MCPLPIPSNLTAPLPCFVQVRIHDHMSEPGKGLYVVSAVKRSVIGIYDYRLTNLIKDDLWVKLKRGGQGEGLAFTAVRKVLAVEDA